VSADAESFNPIGTTKGFNPRDLRDEELDKIFAPYIQKHREFIAYVGDEHLRKEMKIRVNGKFWPKTSKVKYPPYMKNFKKTTMVRFDGEVEWRCLQDRVDPGEEMNDAKSIYMMAIFMQEERYTRDNVAWMSTKIFDPEIDGEIATMMARQRKIANEGIEKINKESHIGDLSTSAATTPYMQKLEGTVLHFAEQYPGVERNYYTGSMPWTDELGNISLTCNDPATTKMVKEWADGERHMAPMCVGDIGREEFTDLIYDKLQHATVNGRACSAFPAEAEKKAMHEEQALGVFDTVGGKEDIGNERDEILQHEQALLEEMPLPGTEKGKAKRRQKWLKLPRPTKAAIRRMHLQFGHLPKQPLYELLKAVKCPPEYLEASKHFKRDTCSRSQHLPKQTQKVSPPKSRLRSPAARIIGFEAPAYQHLHDHADQMPRGEQQAYDDEHHLAPDSEDESGSDDERHVEEVPVGRQEVEPDTEGERIEGKGLPMKRRDKRQRELLDEFPAEAFKPTELRAGSQTPPPTPAPTELRADRSRSPTRATNHREVEQLDLMDVGDHPGSLLGAWNRTATSGAGIEMLRRRHDYDATIALLADSRMPVPVVKGYQK
jgi:hypothetical protein